MLFLFGDIPDNHIFVTQIVRKAGILLRPSVEKREMRVLFEPFAGGDFEFLYKLGHSQRRWQGYKKMNVVGHPADAVEVCPLVVDKSVHVGIELPLVLFGYGGNALVCAENDVVEGLCVAHRCVNDLLITPSSAVYCVGRISPRCLACSRHVA